MEGERKTVREKERKENWVVLLLFQGQSRISMFIEVTMLGKNTLGKNIYLFCKQLTILLFALI